VTSNDGLSGLRRRRGLLDAIAEISEHPVTLAAGDLQAESANTHWLAASAAERAALSVDVVVAALRRAAQALRERVDGPAVLYVWHDRQAAQLRCSITSRPPDDLPFGSDYGRIDDLATIVGAFLDADPAPTVPWELELTVEAPQTEADSPLLVWIFLLSRAHTGDAESPAQG
jgi:hypothetical protein